MPTYTYRCTECGHDFQLFHGMSETGTKPCPVCEGEAQRMIGTGAGLIFKGSGFYETDYKRKNGSNGNGHTPSPPASSSNGSSSSTSSESTSNSSTGSSTSEGSKSESKTPAKSGDSA